MHQILVLGSQEYQILRRIFYGPAWVRKGKKNDSSVERREKERERRKRLMKVNEEKKLQVSYQRSLR